MKKFVLSGFRILLALGSVAAGGDETPLNYEDETEASAALLYLDLYNQGLAGGKSGVCVDLDYDVDGKPQFKAAFDTSAFVTGSSALQSGGLQGQGFDPENFKKMVNALAKIQNGKVNASVDGYADGQHYQSSNFSVDESIKKNEKLSADRANAIADIIKTNPNINIVSTKGHASPYWENKYPGMKEGLNCPTRRKVVVTFEQPSPQISSEMKGDFFRAPEAMDKKVKGEIQKEFKNSVKSAQSELKIKQHKRTGLDKRPDRADVEKIYSKLMKDKKLNPQCDLPPFKQMTLAMIETNITSLGKNSGAKKEDIIESYMEESGFKIKDIDGGQSALQEGCLVPSVLTAGSLQTSVKNYAVSGNSFVSSAGLKTTNGKVKIGFDINSLQAQKVNLGPNKGQTLRGFYCKACGNGLFFHEDPDHKGQFNAEYIDRVVRFGGGEKTQEKFVKNLNSVTNADPFSIGAFLKPRLFVVKNCKDCKCDHTAMIRANDESVIKFDPLAGGQTSAEIPSSDFENACIIRPPVHHACNVQPNKNDGKDQASFQQQLTYESALQNLKFTGSNMNELINKVGSACSEDKKALTADQKISDVMCSHGEKNSLPSDDEKQDCADFDAKKGK